MLRWNVFQILSGQYKRYEELSTRKLYQVFRTQPEITIELIVFFYFIFILVFFYFVIYKYRFISNSVSVLRFLVFFLFLFRFCCWLFPIYNRLYSVLLKEIHCSNWNEKIFYYHLYCFHRQIFLKLNVFYHISIL